MGDSTKYIQTDVGDGSWVTTEVLPDDSFEQELFFKAIELTAKNNASGFENSGFIGQVKELYTGLLDVYNDGDTVEDTVGDTVVDE